MSLVPDKYIPCFGKVVALGTVLGRRVPSSKRQIQKALEKWYRAQARQFFIHGLSQLSVAAVQVRISGAKTRWGSCNPRRRSIMFNWRLALAPLPIARYVLAHEAAHLTHPNHSRQFWQLVAHLDSDFASHRQWLKVHGHDLHRL